MTFTKSTLKMETSRDEPACTNNSRSEKIEKWRSLTKRQHGGKHHWWLLAPWQAVSRQDSGTKESPHEVRKKALARYEKKPPLESRGSSGARRGSAWCDGHLPHLSPVFLLSFSCLLSSLSPNWYPLTGLATNESAQGVPLLVQVGLQYNR